jgi:hypothetical protein
LFTLKYSSNQMTKTDHIWTVLIALWTAKYHPCQKTMNISKRTKIFTTPFYHYWNFSWEPTKCMIVSKLDFTRLPCSSTWRNNLTCFYLPYIK